MLRFAEHEFKRNHTRTEVQQLKGLTEHEKTKATVDGF